MKTHQASREKQLVKANHTMHTVSCTFSTMYTVSPQKNAPMLLEAAETLGRFLGHPVL